MEVLSVISRVLNFTEDEKVIVGLQVPSGSIITSLFQSFANPLLGIVQTPPPPPIQSVPVEVFTNFCDYYFVDNLMFFRVKI